MVKEKLKRHHVGSKEVSSRRTYENMSEVIKRHQGMSGTTYIGCKREAQEAANRLRHQIHRK
jgi:hypothetical protein